MLTEEQKKIKAEYRKNKKIKKWRRRARGRFFKNLLIWFIGFISSLAIVGGAAYIAVGVIPLNNFVGNDEEILSKEVASNSVLSLIQNINGYTVGDFPVLEDALLSLTTGLGVDNLISIDTEKISNLSISAITSGNGVESLLSAITVEATITDVTDMTGLQLGTLTDLDIFTKYDPVPQDKKPAQEEYTSSTFNHNYYYYEKEPGVYAPAFENNDYAPGVTSLTDLYYVPLNNVGLLDLLDIVTRSLDRLKITDIVNNFIEDGEMKDLINNILGDTTISGVGSFDYEKIVLNDIIPASENPVLFDVLKGLSGEEDVSLITIGHLTGIDEDVINSLKLSIILKTKDEQGNPINQDIWNILEGITGEDAENITINTLMNGFTQEKINNIKLSLFVEYAEDEDGNITKNKDLWSLLEGLTGVSGEEITLNTLTSSFTQEKINNIKLSLFVEYAEDEDGNITKNKDLWELLEGITGVSGEEITLNTLTSSFSQEKMNNIKLSLFIEYAEDEDGNITKNKDLWELLKGITGEDDINNITIKDLNVDINSVDVSALLGDESANPEVYELLRNLTGKKVGESITINDIKSLNQNGILLESVLPKKDKDGNAINSAIWDILESVITYDKSVGLTIGDLGNGFNIDNLPLSKVIDAGELWNILNQAVTDKDNNGVLTVGDLKNGFSINKVKLETVLPKKDKDGNAINSAIWDILESVVTPSDSTLGITVSDLGSFNLNNMPLSKVIDDGELWNILNQAVTDKDANGVLTVGDLKNGFSIDRVKLETVLPKKDKDGNAINSAIWDILESVVTPSDSTLGITVSDLGSFNLNNMPLSKVVDAGELWNILNQAVTDEDNNGILNVGDLKNGFSIDRVKLETVLPKKDKDGNAINSAIWDILESVVTPSDSTLGITVSDLGSFNLNNMPLSKVVDAGDLWDILNQAVTDEDANGVLTVGDLKNGFNIKSVKLETVLPNTEANKSLWDILTEVVAYDKNVGITIGDLGSFNLDTLPLAKAIPNDGGLLWQILTQADTPNDTTIGITIGDLKGNFKVDEVMLETVLPNNSTNSAIWNILKEAVSPSNQDGKIRIKDLGAGFNMENISLSTVYPDDGSTLWGILKEAISPSDTSKGITIYDLKNNFNINNVHLSSVIQNAGGNQVLEALLLDEDATLGNIGSKLNNLKLKEMYDINCFTNIASEAAPGSPKYSYSKLSDETGNHDHYTLDENGDYYIKKDAGVWLLLLYKADNKNANGDALTYTCKCLTLGSLTNTILSAADCFMNASIKMLVTAGFLIETIPNQYSQIYHLSVKNVFDIAAFGLAQ